MSKAKKTQKKFDEAREKLAAALQNLEEVTIAKIHETSKNSLIMQGAEGDESSLRVKIFEQSTIISNLSDELNKIQKTTNETSKENDFLKDKNKLFADKVLRFKTQGSSFIEAIESDLSKIKEIIKNYS